MLTFRSCCRIESWFKLASKEIYDHGIWSFVSQGLSWWPLTPSAQYSMHRHPARWMGEKGSMLQTVWQGNRTKPENNTSSWPWDVKWSDKRRGPFGRVYILPVGHPLGFYVFFFCPWHNFAECCFRGELVVVLALFSGEAWHSHCVEALFLPWPLQTFFQKTECLCLICGYTQRRWWLEMRAPLCPQCSKMLPYWNTARHGLKY